MLIVESSAQERFAEVMAHAAKHNLLSQLISVLSYLDNYANGDGCRYAQNEGSNTRCTLYYDHAPLSFQFGMEKFDASEAKPVWKLWYGGGLIYQGPDQPADGSAPSLTVSLNSMKTGWFTHT